METLRGSLETFPIESVVRLVAASGRTGMLRLELGDLIGRAYFRRGTLVYATTRADDGPTAELYRFRTLDAKPERERRGQTDERPWPQPEADLIRQQTVEVFVRLLRETKGEFAFVPGETPRGMSGFEEIGFDHEAIMDEANERRLEWRSIEAVIPNPSMRFGLAPELPHDQFEVTLDAGSWRFLAAVGSGGTAEEIAERLRIFEFPAARKVAEFVGQGLLVPQNGAPTGSPNGETESEPPAIDEPPIASSDGDEHPAEQGEGGYAPEPHPQPSRGSDGYDPSGSAGNGPVGYETTGPDPAAS